MKLKEKNSKYNCTTILWVVFFKYYYYNLFRRQIEMSPKQLLKKKKEVQYSTLRSNIHLIMKVYKIELPEAWLISGFR